MRKIICLLCAVLCLSSIWVAIAEVEEYQDFNDEDVSIGEFVEVEYEDNEDESSLMYIIGEPYVRLRSTDSTEKPYVAKMPYGSEVTVISTRINDLGEKWSLVRYNGEYGYCMVKHLDYEVDILASETCPMTMEEAFGTTLLQRGNKSPRYTVKNLQLCLIDGGFLSDDKGADGYFGKNTYKALCAFQKSQGLDQAGRAGETTKTRLWYIYADFLKKNGVMQ